MNKFVCREIGSEFHWMPLNEGIGISLPKGVSDFCLPFSGRTAIETVLRNEPNIKKALLPSYCCDSMIEPFRKARIQVSFYDVSYSDGLKIDLQIADDIGAVLWCNYFGFTVDMPDFTHFISCGGTLIEDITHSLFSAKQYHSQSKYLVGSIRKWGPVLCGGYCATTSGELVKKPSKYPDTFFIENKISAMKRKNDYLLSLTDDTMKTLFLSEFSNSNHWLAEHYSNLMIDNESLEYLSLMDCSVVCAMRRKNAEVLYAGLEQCQYVHFLFDIEDMDCPLFVPVVIENGKRDVIRKRLIENQIYCPIHWPKPSDECCSNLYDIELSLICDQRYDETDMERIVKIINGCQ